MKQYEYKIIDGQSYLSTKELNELGLKGWKLVGMAQTQGNYQVGILIRELKKKRNKNERKN